MEGWILAGYSLWGQKESDTTERLTLVCICVCVYIYICLYIYQCIYIYMEKAMAAHSSTLAWKIPWTEEPGGL